MKITNIIAGTRPIIVHAPGTTVRNKPLWPYIYNCYIQSKPKKINPKDMDDLTIITWNSDYKKSVLEDCLDRMDIPHIVLGRGIKDWKNIFKIKLTTEVLKNIKTKYVMGLDAYDVLLFASPREAVERFKNFQCEMLFNAGPYFYPNCHRYEGRREHFITRDWDNFQANLSAGAYWRYLNAGAWIGKADFCRQFFTDCLSQNTDELIATGKLPTQKEKGVYYREINESEQLVLHIIFQRYFPQVKLDHDCELFLNLSMVPASGKQVRLYRSFYEIPGEEWICIAKGIKDALKNRLIKFISLGEYAAVLINIGYRLSARLKEKCAPYKRFIAFMKGGMGR